MLQVTHDPAEFDPMVQRGLAGLYSERIAPTAHWSDMGRREHFVQFYEASEFLVDSVAEYLIHGLRSGETCIVAATQEHIDEIERIILRFGTDLEAARASNRYIPLDAGATLARFMVDDRPDDDLFIEVIGSLVEKASKRSGGIRVFGEMVAVLWADENYNAAIRLEELWNELRQQHTFSLFCGYPMKGFKDSTAAGRMAQVCDGHSRVIPDESYTSLTSADERLRAIALLQQKARCLEAESDTRCAV